MSEKHRFTSQDQRETHGQGLSEEDRSLVAALKRGSKAAFVTLMRRESIAVRGALARHIERLADVDDLAQDVFLTAFRGMDRFEGRASLRTWLLGIARNRALTFRRDEGRRRAREGDVAEMRLNQWEIERLENEVELDGDRLARLRNCVQRLGERQRALVERFYFRGESAEAIAQDGKRGGAAVRMSLLRLRGILRTCVEGERGDD
ncbi:MAG: RNA polymerase sigma-70 factor (ECF subfamily) [Planctomycetota bacterium]|jgi:RNA polymerase sigma-70 factor (ECF subfamily)